MRRAALRATIGLVIALELLVVALVSCAPSGERSFAVVVHNVSPTADHVHVSWAVGGVYVGETTRRIEGFGATRIVTGIYPPELVTMESNALNTSWGRPDWGGALVFHIAYPTGATWVSR